MQQLHSPASLWFHLTHVSPNFPFISSSMFDLISYLWNRSPKFVTWQDSWPWEHGQASHVPQLFCVVLLERNPEFGSSQRQCDELMNAHALLRGSHWTRGHGAVTGISAADTFIFKPTGHLDRLQISWCNASWLCGRRWSFASWDQILAPHSKAESCCAGPDAGTFPYLRSAFVVKMWRSLGTIVWIGDKTECKTTIKHCSALRNSTLKAVGILEADRGHHYDKGMTRR